MRKPAYWYGLVAFGAVAGLTGIIWWYGHPLNGPQSVWIAVTLVTFLTFGYDKAIAGTGRTRVPENTLLLLALLGGTPGALVAMRLFRHKTAKRPFHLKLGLIVTVQVVLIASYFTLAAS